MYNVGIFDTSQNKGTCSDAALDEWILTYSGVLKNALDIIEGKVLAKRYIDPGRVATVSQKIGQESFYQSIKAQLKEGKGHSLLSLACGSGQIAIDYVRLHSSHTAICVDRSLDACKLVQRAASDAGVADRIEIINKDISELIHDRWDIISRSDIVEYSFGLHDYLAEHGMEATLDLLQGISKNMSKSAAFILCEAIHAKYDSPWFSKMFNLVHEIQNIYLPDDAGWRNIFRSAEFLIVKAIDTGMPGSRLYLLVKHQPHQELPHVPVFKPIPGHHKPVPFYLHSDMGLNISIAAVDLGSLDEACPADPHQHETEEWYILPDYPEEVSIMVTINGGSPLQVKSPSILRIPSRTLHSFAVSRAKPGQFIFGIFPDGGV
jgi:hypothetical protein